MVELRERKEDRAWVHKCSICPEADREGRNGGGKKVR